MSRWRDVAAPIIARVLAETRGQPESEIRKALRDAYPFGERRYHPYKIWLSEIAAQRLKLVEDEIRHAMCIDTATPLRTPPQVSRANARDADRARQMFVDAGKPIPAWLGAKR